MPASQAIIQHDPKTDRHRGVKAVISSNSSVSKPIPIASLGQPPLRGAAPLPSPSDKLESSRVQFTGAGGEYFRIWIVNLLLILITFGIYLPWAKVRKLKYFYNNTQIDGYSLDFHGNARQMLRGTLIAGVFFVMYSFAADFSVVAAWIAGLAFIAIWPPIYRAAVKFRLANTSWRGMRFRLQNASLKEAYLSVGVPNALILIPLLMLSTAGAGEEVKKAAFSDTEGIVFLVGFALFLLALPYFLWRIYRYQITHTAWGPLQMQFRTSAWSMYKLFLKAFGIVFLLCIAAGVVMALFMPGIFSKGRPSFGLIFAILPVLFVFFILVNVLPKAYLGAALQNLTWSRTGNSWLRFKSELGIGRYMGLQIKNYLLIMITFGLYWPFAVVANKRMQLEAVSLKSRIALDKLTDVARAREKDAVGDMAADIFDMDFGL
jgi:uncharacterized membrane protein YjgN (DUF898 family)